MFSKETYVNRRACLVKKVGDGVLLFLLLSSFVSCDKEACRLASVEVNNSKSVSLLDIDIYLKGVKNIPPTRSTI